MARNSWRSDSYRRWIFASEEVCIEIERQWLAATGGRIFHLTDYGTPSCKLGSADWKPSERLGFLKRLAGIINRPDVKIVSSSLEASEYSKFLEKTNYEDIWGPAYSGLAMGSVARS